MDDKNKQDNTTEPTHNDNVAELEEKIKALEAQAAECENMVSEYENKVSEYENNWKRALADYRNLQKRTEEEKDSVVNYISSALLKRMLPVVDNLEMLQKHINDTGLNLIVKEFKQILNEEGVTEIQVQDQDFDPQTMDAIDTVEGPEDKVVEVLAKGYMFKNKLLKPARVKVGKSKEESAKSA
jgi:molecular chaperone GrpE